LGSRDVIGHVTIRLPGSTFYGWSIGWHRYGDMAFQILYPQTWTRKERWKKGKRKWKGRKRERCRGREKERGKGRKMGKYRGRKKERGKERERRR